MNLGHEYPPRHYNCRMRCRVVLFVSRSWRTPCSPHCDATPGRTIATGRPRHSVRKPKRRPNPALEDGNKWVPPQAMPKNFSMRSVGSGETRSFSAPPFFCFLSAFASSKLSVPFSFVVLFGSISSCIQFSNVKAVHSHEPRKQKTEKKQKLSVNSAFQRKKKKKERRELGADGWGRKGTSE